MRSASRTNFHIFAPSHISRPDQPCAVEPPPSGVWGLVPGATPTKPGSLPPAEKSKGAAKRTSYDMQAESYEPGSLTISTLPRPSPLDAMNLPPSSLWRTTLPEPR